MLMMGGNTIIQYNGNTLQKKGNVRSNVFYICIPPAGISLLYCKWNYIQNSIRNDKKRAHIDIVKIDQDAKDKI